MNDVQLVWVLGIQCKRCKGVWIPKNFNVVELIDSKLKDIVPHGKDIPEAPHVCAKCRSPYYDRERIRK